MSKFESVVEELKTLPPAGLTAAGDYIHQLKLSGSTERRKALNRAFGCLSPAEADELENAVIANCERIDARQW